MLLPQAGVTAVGCRLPVPVCALHAFMLYSIAHPFMQHLSLPRVLYTSSLCVCVCVLQSNA